MYLDVLVYSVNVLILVLMVMVGVAFLTLLERKVLGYIQIRKGPNKVGLMGLLQPFSDAVKLLSKEMIFPNMSNYYPFYFSPVYIFFLALMSWMLMPYYWILSSFNLGLLFLMSMLSVGVYGVMLSGWSSTCLFSMVGCLRCVAQSISYEVSMIFIMISVFILTMSYSLLNLYFFQYSIYFVFVLLPLGMIMIVSMMAETNRTPFDFAEAESELVSGFNVEYSSGGFALIFLGEYCMIIFMSMLFVIMFVGSNMISWSFSVKIMFISFLFIWIRGSLPRYRYDKLMALCWKSFLMVSLLMMTYYCNLYCFLSETIM
uniref:NADH-ubiquinone oxidoreductase chain 1 n=1 Tax=Dorypteryx domestica TaxID=209979 RepID=A0A343QCA8_9NEOP|nr:NADH dehydrogenase subunit 1 [Dorypteryx domestica]ATU07055.1 NADH dehydrogenase subunit 1 [Dorypteryx domestica]